MSPPHISSKYWCTNATAIAPSPTAEATTHERRATGQVGHVAGELADLDKLVAGPVVFERRSGAAPERGVLPVWRNTSIAQPTSAVGQGPIDRADAGD